MTTNIDAETGACQPEKFPLEFKGAGADGKKEYPFQCSPGSQNNFIASRQVPKLKGTWKILLSGFFYRDRKRQSEVHQVLFIGMYY
jgi:hypothetical protein